MKKRSVLKKKTVLLLAVSAVLLLGSTVGITSAALTYYSEDYTAEIQTPAIEVSLVENGKETTKLLKSIQENLVLGKTYEEVISVTNKGTMDTYVRVILKKSWQNEDGLKNTSLSPELIELNLTGDGWVVDETATTKERTVIYYTGVLKSGASTTALSDTFRIDPEVSTKIVEIVTSAGNGKTITYEYEYDGYSAHMDVEVNAVQTHNAQGAIKSAWGVDVNIAADGTLSLR